MSRLLADHDARRVRVAGHQCRHDGGVGHPQAPDPVNAQLVIHHRPRVLNRSHLARADVVVNGVTEMANDAFPICVGEGGVIRTCRVRLVVELRPELFELSGRSDLEGVPYSGDQRFHVERIVKEVRLDPRVVERVRGSKQDPAFASRMMQDRID